MSFTAGEPGRLVRHGGTANLFAAGMLLWLINHPYQGVWHDANIYGLLAAHWLHPEALANDLFFRFGSQGEFSLFTPLYGTLTEWLGLDRASWWVVLSGAAGWLAAVMVLAQRMLGPGVAVSFAVLLAAVVTVSYSPNASTFVLIENFATARSWAFPCGLASVAVLAAGRSHWALLPAVVSLLLHPLVGVWPLALCALVWLRLRTAAMAVSLAVLAVMLVGLANTDVPYLRLMTGEWLAFAREGAPDVVFKIGRSRLDYYGAALACLFAASRWGTERSRQIYLSGLLLGLGGLALALIASVWMPLELIVQGQSWRVCWLLLPLAMIGLLDIGQRVFRSSRTGSVLVAAAAAVAILGPSWWLPVLYLMGLGAFAPLSLWQRLDDIAARWRKLLAVTTGLIWLLLLPGLVAIWDMSGSGLLAPWWNGAEWLQGLVTGGNWHVAALLALFPAWRPGRLNAMSVAGVLATLILGLMIVLPLWDRRPEPRRTEESCYLDARCPPHPFRQRIASGETVFWPGRELTVWFELNRASYHGIVQRTGVVFSRAKFEEWARRDALVTASRSQADICADPILDWLVLPDLLAGATPRATVRSAYLYACADFRPPSVQ